jgi:tripartite-type tricarboxylate transporter receptor subunit TctC
MDLRRQRGSAAMKIPRRRFLQLAGGVTAFHALAQIAQADDYPSRPIRLIVGFTPGTATDIAARTLANGAEGLLGQKMVVENRPGAGSGLAAEYVGRAANDGYTIFVATLSLVTIQAMKPNPAFDLARDFAPITLLAKQAVVLVVNPQSNLRSVSELIALAKSKPGEVLCANVGIGSLPHFAAVLFAQRAGINLTHVPYPGSPQAVNDLLGGRVTMFFSPASTVVGQIAAGQLRALATASDRRASVLPDVQSIAEAGIPDFDTSLWFGLLAPARTPRLIIDKLASVADEAMQAPEAIETLKKQGFDPHGGGPQALELYLRSEINRWSDVARAAGVKG